MKISKWLIGSSLVAAPIVTICPSLLTSCSNDFEAHTDTHYLHGSETHYQIPLSFSNAPTHEVIVKLIAIEDSDLDGLTLTNPRFKIENNQAMLELQVSDTLWTNKQYRFNIQITYDDMQMPFVLEDFTLLYIFDQPESEDKIKLVSEKNAVAVDKKAIYTIQFEKMPVGEVVTTSLTDVNISDPNYTVSTSTQATVQKKAEKLYIEFSVKINGSIPTSLDYWASFNLQLNFLNHKGSPQENVIYGCSLTHPHEE